MTRFHYERSADGEEWEPVTGAAMRDALAAHYRNVEAAVTVMHDGLEIRTPFAFYRVVIDDDTAQERANDEAIARHDECLFGL